MKALENLHRILTPPPKPVDTGSPAAWVAAESALGISYPPDFKEYVATYGSGTLSKVIGVFNPMSVDWAEAPPFTVLPTPLDTLLGHLGPYGNARDVWLYGLASTLAVCESFDSAVLPGSDNAVPIRLWPELPGLFPWARGDAGQALLWWVDGAPETWPVLLVDPSEGPIAFPMDMTDFLAGWLAGSLRPAYLPPAGKPRFHREVS
jgi:hypothetical protein